MLLSSDCFEWPRLAGRNEPRAQEVLRAAASDLQAELSERDGAAVQTRLEEILREHPLWRAAVVIDLRRNVIAHAGHATASIKGATFASSPHSIRFAASQTRQ